MGCKIGKLVRRIAPVSDRREGTLPPLHPRGDWTVNVLAFLLAVSFRHPGIASQIIHGSPLVSSIEFHPYLQEKSPGLEPTVVLYSWSKTFQGSAQL